MKGPKAPYILAAISILATLWVTLVLTSEFFGIVENVVGLVGGLVIGLAIAQTYIVPKQKMQWERIRLRRKYGNTGRYRELAPPDEEERTGGWAGFFSPRTWNTVNIILGIWLLLMLFAFGVLNILTAAMGAVTMVNIRMVMVTHAAVKRIEEEEAEELGHN